VGVVVINVVAKKDSNFSSKKPPTQIGVFFYPRYLYIKYKSMKHLFNDISKDEKNRILEMHKTATDKYYLTENLNLNDIMNDIHRKISQVESETQLQRKMMAAWGRCKTQHKFVGLSVFTEIEILRLLLMLFVYAQTELYLDKYGAEAPPETLRKLEGLLDGFLDKEANKLKEYSETQENIKELEPDFRQEVEWLFGCVKSDNVLMGYLGF